MARPGPKGSDHCRVVVRSFQWAAAPGRWVGRVSDGPVGRGICQGLFWMRSACWASCMGDGGPARVRDHGSPSALLAGREAARRAGAGVRGLRAVLSLVSEGETNRAAADAVRATWSCGTDSQRDQSREADEAGGTGDQRRAVTQSERERVEAACARARVGAAREWELIVGGENWRTRPGRRRWQQDRSASASRLEGQHQGRGSWWKPSVTRSWWARLARRWMTTRWHRLPREG